MKQFNSKQFREMASYVAQGGQALHVWFPKSSHYDAPACFNKTKENGWGHLLDGNKKRLERTAKKLGVKGVVVSQEGKRGQHVDLCGRPLRKAIQKCKEG